MVGPDAEGEEIEEVDDGAQARGCRSWLRRKQREDDEAFWQPRCAYLAVAWPRFPGLEARRRPNHRQFELKEGCV